MMKKSRLLVKLAIVLLFTTISCDPRMDDLNEENSNDPTEDTSGSEPISLNIPDDFDFSTQRAVSLQINDNSEYAVYTVYGYTDDSIYEGSSTYDTEEGETITESVYRSDVLNHYLFTAVVKNGQLEQSIVVPTYIKQLYLRRRSDQKFSSKIIDIVGSQAQYNHRENASTGATQKEETSTFGRSSNVTNDFLYCVNGSGQLFEVDPLTGTLNDLSAMPMGSFTCAIDQANGLLYSIGKSSPYPLMKYSIADNTWETVANMGRGGPRLDYNAQDGLLYFSSGSTLYAYDPATGATLNTWRINGLHNTSGGDLSFAEDGTLFLCTFSGLYRLELNANNEYDSTRISADNLPFQPTSMTFDSNQELWLANNASSSDLIVMDTQTGGWIYRYGVSAGNTTNFGRTINDLTTFRTFTEPEVDPDTDGDGVLDREDSYPNDAEKAYEFFTPSKYGWGTVAFEDLWTSYGDYDFNDLAVNYRAVAIMNADNLVVAIDFLINVKSNRASFVNGFGIEIESLTPSQVASVAGYQLQHNYISLVSNGTEQNQDHAVIIIFDDPGTFLNNERTITVNLTTPMSTSELGPAPFNPFMIVNKNREKEVHLPGARTTNLGIRSFEVAGVNGDADGNYINDNGLPWGISIIHDFKVPKERIPILDAYNFFRRWANSGGAEYPDWYKDNPGYRNTGNIIN